jgi:hypothetical protein
MKGLDNPVCFIDGCLSLFDIFSTLAAMMPTKGVRRSTRNTSTGYREKRGYPTLASEVLKRRLIQNVQGEDEDQEEIASVEDERHSTQSIRSADLPKEAELTTGDVSEEMQDNPQEDHPGPISGQTQELPLVEVSLKTN